MVYKLTMVRTYVEAEPTRCMRVHCPDGESLSTHLSFAYVVRCYTNHQHISIYQPVHSAPSCYALVAKHLRMRGGCKTSLKSLVSLRNRFIV